MKTKLDFPNLFLISLPFTLPVFIFGIALLSSLYGTNTSLQDSVILLSAFLLYSIIYGGVEYLLFVPILYFYRYAFKRFLFLIPLTFTLFYYCVNTLFCFLCNEVIGILLTRCSSYEDLLIRSLFALIYSSFYWCLHIHYRYFSKT